MVDRHTRMAQKADQVRKAQEAHRAIPLNPDDIRPAVIPDVLAPIPALPRGPRKRDEEATPTPQPTTERPRAPRVRSPDEVPTPQPEPQVTDKLSDEEFAKLEKALKGNSPSNPITPGQQVMLSLESAPFEGVLPFLKMGHRAQRTGWNGKRMWIQIVVPAAANELPYLVMKTAQESWVPWLASQTDILAHDWRLLSVDDQG